MSNKSLIIAAIFVTFALGSSIKAQDQSQGSVLGSTAGSVDSQGIRRYLLGPGDVIDVRVPFVVASLVLLADRVFSPLTCRNKP